MPKRIEMRKSHHADVSLQSSSMVNSSRGGKFGELLKINVEYVFLDIRVTHTLPKDLQLSKRCPQMDFKCQMTVQIYEIISNLK